MRSSIFGPRVGRTDRKRIYDIPAFVRLLIRTRPLQSVARHATIADVVSLLERELELATVRAFVRRGGVLVVEGRAGMGKTALLDATCMAAQRVGRLVLRARGSDLESDFAFGIARQLLERWCTDTTPDERAALFLGSAGAARALVMPGDSGRQEEDTSFAVVHGLYWLVVNLAARRPVLLAVDDAHWGDDASLRWLAYLAARLDGIAASLVVSLRPHEPRSQGRPLQAVRAAASATLRPDLLSEKAVAAIAQKMLGNTVADDVFVSIHRATGGNPFYVMELVLGLKRANHPRGERVIEDAVSRGDLDGVALQLGARLRSLSPYALRLAQAIAVLGDGCELRHAAVISQMQIAYAISLATGLVRLDVLGDDRPPRFTHPIVQYAVLQTLSSAEHDTAHRAAAGVLYAEHLPPGRIAAHVKRLRPVGDPWAAERLCEGARAALENGAPAAAANLLERALAEPPPAEVRVEVLRAAARAELLAGRASACQRLEEAVGITEGRLQAELGSELAQTYATLFRWADAVEVLERTLGSLGETHRSLAAQLQSQLVAAGLQDARVAARALQAMKRMSRRRLSGSPAATLALAQGMVAIFTGLPADEAARPLERALTGMRPQTENWDALAALW